MVIHMYVPCSQFHDFAVSFNFETNSTILLINFFICFKASNYQIY